MKGKIVETGKRFGRMMKLQYIKLLRSPGGARKVATGFAIGFGMEMLVISTAMVIYLFLIPIVRIARGSLPASIIGNLICKATFLPVILLPAAIKLGKLLAPIRPPAIPRSIFYYLHTLLGMSVFAAVLGFFSFFPVYYLYEARRKHRERARHLSRTKRAKVEQELVTLHEANTLENTSRSTGQNDQSVDVQALDKKAVSEHCENGSETRKQEEMQAEERAGNSGL